MTRPIEAAVLEGYGLKCLRENFAGGVGRGLKDVPTPDYLAAASISPENAFLNPRERYGMSVEGFSPGGAASNSIARDGRCVCNPLRRECAFLKGTAYLASASIRPYVITSDSHSALTAEGRPSIPPPRFPPTRRGRENGQATLEMVVSLTVVFSLVFWLFELCMFTYTCSVLNYAAQEGVRYAIMHGTDSSICSGPDTGCTNQTPYSNVQAVVTAAASASLHNTSAMTVTVSYANSTAATGNPVAVRVAYTYVPYLNFPGLADALTFTSQGQILY
jgi:Flp pilus assembly protein TadG